MVAETIYYSYVGDHSQKQGHLGKARVDMARLSWAMWEQGERGREERGEPGVAARPKVQKGVCNQNVWIMQGRTLGGKAALPLAWSVQGRGWGMPTTLCIRWGLTTSCKLSPCFKDSKD